MDPTQTTEAERLGAKMAAQMDPSVGVGSRHHTVPRFLLERFSQHGKVAVRDLVTGVMRPNQNINDLAIKDFYTFVAEPGDASTMSNLDGSIEQILSDIEGRAAAVLQSLDDSPGSSLVQSARGDLAQFLSFQIVRGVRRRKEVELSAEFYVKTMMSQGQIDRRAAQKAEVRHARRSGRTPARGNGRSWKTAPDRSRISEADLRQITIQPHPNEHIQLMCELAPTLFQELVTRPVTLIELDQPLLLLGDEPVIVIDRAPRTHLPACALTPEQRIRALRRAVKSGRQTQDIIHIYPTRPSGFATAQQIAVPVSSNKLLLLGPKGGEAVPHVQLEGAQGVALADDLNGRTLDQAYLWVVAHPQHSTFNTLAVPPRAPLFEICDGDNAAAAGMSSVPTSVRPRRLAST